MIPVLSFVGKSGVGKTTLIEKLVTQMRSSGYRIAVVKHHGHTTPIDVPGKDSWRFIEAGASLAVVSSPVEIVRFERVPRQATLNEIVAQIHDVDLILAEGFKHEAMPKIQVSRAALGTEFVESKDELIAVVSDHPITLDIPRFDLEDVLGIRAFIEARFIR